MNQLLSVALIPFTGIYGAAVAIRNWGFDVGLLQVRRVQVPVVSVGNITVGGSGKTPVVEFLVDYLLRRNYRPAVVSRGYRRKSKGTVIVSDGKRLLVDVRAAGDEPLQIAKKFPEAIVVVDEQRLRGARAAIAEARAQVIILDDGFQHRWLYRDCDIVVVDDDDAPENRRLLPAGRLREPLRALRRANAILYVDRQGNTPTAGGVQVKESNSVSRFSVTFHVGEIHDLVTGTRESPAELKGKRCIAFCGIARPERFKSSLDQMGVVVESFVVFGDHHDFGPSDIQRVSREADKKRCDIIITTEKDATRLTERQIALATVGKRLYEAILSTRVENEDGFAEFLNKYLGH